MTKQLVLLAALVAALACTASASAATRVFFAFHRYTNTNSWLTIYRQDAATGEILSQHGFRAGSGTSTDACASGAGWLPAGWYDLVGHFDYYNGSAIKGRVWQLSDKRCSGGTGTLRTELFIHSEEWSDEGQYCPTIYDDPFCWEGDFDYRSHGCIKLAHAQPYPSDIGKTDADWDAWDGRHGYFSQGTALYVS
jgi:hypothetical protein